MSRQRGRQNQNYSSSSLEREKQNEMHLDYSPKQNDANRSRQIKERKDNKKVKLRSISSNNQYNNQNDTVEIQRPFRQLKVQNEENKLEIKKRLDIDSQNQLNQMSDSNNQIKKESFQNLDKMSEQISQNKQPISPSNNEKILSLNRQRKTKKIQKYESESIDEEEFKDYFQNPVKRKEFDKQRKRLQMKELESINAFSLGNYGIKDIKALKKALPKIEDNDAPIVQDKQKTYATVSLCCLSVTNPFRNFIIQIVIYNQWFDRFIQFVILMNCLFLAMDKGVDFVTNNSDTIDLVFLCIYTTEMVLKIIAMGFFMREFTYLRDGWNILDFCVVLLGWVSILVNSNKISSIKVIRILRPLRTINQIPNMSSLVLTIVNSMPIVFDVGVLFVFCLIMFGTIGTQLLGGHLQKSCTIFNEIGNSSYFLGDQQSQYFCQDQSDCDLQLPDLNTNCIYQGNPISGTFHFDNILISMMNLFIVISLEGWTQMMYYIRQSEYTYLYDAYFVGCVIIGNYIILNLMVAVQASYLDDAFDQEEARIKEYNEKKEAKRLAKQKQEEEEILQGQMEQIISDEEEEEQPNQTNPNVRRRPNAKKQKKSCCKNPCKNYTPPEWYKKLSKLCENFTKHIIFENFIVFLIILNTIALACQFYQMPQWLINVTNWANFTFMILFTFEMVLKLIAYGIRGYIQDNFNSFDSFIVVMSYIDYFTPGDTPQIKMLRAFRLLRIFKILRKWGELKKLIGAVAKSLTAIKNLGILIILYLFIGSLLCKQFLAEYKLIDSDGNASRYDFSSTINSVITMFIILTGENWNDVMTQVIFAVGNSSIALLIIFLLIIGNILLLNLFLGILLRSISEPDEEQEVVNQDQSQVQKPQDDHNDSKTNIQKEQAPPLDKVENESKQNSTNSNIEEEFKQIQLYIQDLLQNQDLNQPQFNNSIYENKSCTDRESDDEQQKDEEQDESFCQAFCQIMNNEYSLFIFGPKNRFRIFLQYLLIDSQFSGFIYAIIGLNSLLLILDVPALDDPYQKSTIKFVINIVSGIFIAECVLKVIAYGFYWGQKTYLKDNWNKLDFLIVFFSILTWILEASLGGDVSFIRAFRALRALRPLRVVSRNEGMKTVVDALLESIPALFNVLLIVLLFLLVFGILGVQLLVGQLGQCNNDDPSITNKTLCDGNYTVNNLDAFGNIIGTEEQSMIWTVPPNNYDYISYSMLTFFETATLEAWPSALWTAVDSVGLDQSQQENYSQPMFLLFVFYIFFVTFFIMNLFVSVIVDKFNDEIKKRQGSVDFSHEQQEWVKVQRLLIYTNPKIIPVEPINCFRLKCFRIVQSQFFEYIVMAAITVNTIFLCMDYYGKSDELAQTLLRANYFFVIFFAIELILKMISYGFTYYWYINWNKFDMVIVFLSLLTLDDSWLLKLHFNVTALRIIRVARLLRMIKTSEGIRQLLKTLFMSIMNILNTGALLVLIFFTFSVVGMSLFNDQEYTDQFTKDANFTTFYLSMMTLFRCATGENWNGFMHDSFLQYGITSVIFWVTFMLIASLIFLNVFIAVIGESFEENQATEDEGDILALRKKDIKAFQNTWAKFNPMGEVYMKTIRLQEFLRDLPTPLGYQGIRIELTKLNKIIFCLNIRDHQGHVYYPEVMWSIFHSVAGMNDESVINCKQIKNVLRLIKMKYPDLGKKITLDTLCGNRLYRTDVTAIKYIQAMRILQIWREFKVKRLQKKELDEQQEILKISEVNQKFEGSRQDENEYRNGRLYQSPRSHVVSKQNSNTESEDASV